ncbi:MAG TPA: DUF4352 domain-containing protein [Solirubrobacterales bacterium]|nr:DUF4352 domain-containing protein [Solirubrobacterales bacterium]
MLGGILLLLLAGVAGALVAGGGDSTTVVKTVTATEAETSSGFADEGEAESDPVSKDDAEGDCETAGISAPPRREGTCFEEGQKWVVVNKGSVLKLKTLEAELLGIRDAKTLSSDLGPETANGTFVTFELTITNLTRAPAYFEEEQAVLYIDGNVYTQDFEVQNGTEQRSFGWQGTEIQPQNTLTGTITFDVPDKVLANLDSTGNLDIGNFGAEELFAEEEIGTIRTYQ